MDGYGNPHDASIIAFLSDNVPDKQRENIQKLYGDGSGLSTAGKGRVKPLYLGGSEAGNVGRDIKPFQKDGKGYIPDDLVAMNKTWGQVQPSNPKLEDMQGQVTGGTENGGWYNGGILADNIYVSKDTYKVNRKVPNIRGEQNTVQHLIELTARGDFYKHDDIGDKITGIYKPHSSFQCPLDCTPYRNRSETEQNNFTGLLQGYNESREPTTLDVGARTGACVVTKDLFGPGYYEATVWIPHTDWGDDGRGYVFAMWMFQYSEAYSNNGESTTFPFGF